MEKSILLLWCNMQSVACIMHRPAPSSPLFYMCTFRKYFSRCLRKKNTEYICTFIDLNLKLIIVFIAEIKNQQSYFLNSLNNIEFGATCANKLHKKWKKYLNPRLVYCWRFGPNYSKANLSKVDLAFTYNLTQ